MHPHESPADNTDHTLGTNPQLPSLKLPDMFRLGLYQMGLGMMALLLDGIINRLMIKELTIPGSIALGLTALPLLVAPARVWFGQLSDARSMGGYHRTGYVWLGTLIFGAVMFLSVQAMWQLGLSLYQSGWSGVTIGWMVLLAVLLAIYGLAISASSTPFAALLVDSSDEANRSKLVGIVWSMLMVGIVVGAITISRPLPCVEQASNLSLFAQPERLAQLQAGVNTTFTGVIAVVMGLAVAATYGIEGKYSRFLARKAEDRLRRNPQLLDDAVDAAAPPREDAVTLKDAWRILTASRQTGLFFSFLILMTFGLFMQDGVLEPFGGEVFGMSICQTTQLNAFFGIGTLLGLTLAGFVIVPKIGKQKTAKYGCIAVGCCSLLLAASGFTGQRPMLQGALLCFGLASGMTTSGALSLMLDLTAVETAGTFIGAWGLAQALARGLAKFAGGIALDVGRVTLHTPPLAYGLVFVLEGGLLLLAVWLLSRVNVQEFRDDAKRAIAAVFASELD
ncbi:MAG: BCD family MFS transporter [Pseudanabaena sp. ELA607]